MRGMDLDRVEAQTCGTARCFGKGIADVVHARLIEFDRCDVIRPERQRRRCDGLPPLGLIRRDLRATLSGQVG